MEADWKEINGGEFIAIQYKDAIISISSVTLEYVLKIKGEWYAEGHHLKGLKDYAVEKLKQLGY